MFYFIFFKIKLKNLYSIDLENLIYLFQKERQKENDKILHLI